MSKQRNNTRNHHGMQVVTLCISTTMVLILLGMVVFFVLTARNLSAHMRENLTVTVMLGDSVTVNDAHLLCRDLYHRPYSHNIDYISKEQAAKEQVKALGSDPTEFLGFNPFPATLEIQLKSDYANRDSLKWIAREIRKDSRVSDLTYMEDLMDKILDGAEIHIEISANELVFTLNSAKDNTLFKPVNVGYGHGYVLPVITSLVIAKNNETLIVENPEAHLHPAAQAKLMNVIINYAIKKNLQVLVETHSDHILNTALLAVKNEDLKLSMKDLQILFFSGKQGVDGHFESMVQNLEITKDGHILNPPMHFFEQYAIDLEHLYF